MIKLPIRICQHFFTGDLCGFIRDRNREGHPLRPHKSVGEDVKSSGSGHTQLIADGTHLRLHLRIYTKSHVCIHGVASLHYDYSTDYVQSQIVSFRPRLLVLLLQVLLSAAHKGAHDPRK